MSTFQFFSVKMGCWVTLMRKKKNFFDFIKWLQWNKEWTFKGVWILSVPTVHRTFNNPSEEGTWKLWNLFFLTSYTCYTLTNALHTRHMMCQRLLEELLACRGVPEWKSLGWLSQAEDTSLQQRARDPWTGTQAAPTLPETNHWIRATRPVMAFQRGGDRFKYDGKVLPWEGCNVLNVNMEAGPRVGQVGDGLDLFSWWTECPLEGELAKTSGFGAWLRTYLTDTSATITRKLFK